MNRITHKLIITVVLCTVLTSCTGMFGDINRNPNEVTESQMQSKNYKIGSNVRSLQGLVVPVQEHMYQFNESLSGGPFAGYIGATVDTWETKFETYNPSADWRKWPFANVITEAYSPYRDIVNGTEDPVANALALLLKVAIMHRVTDSYGPIPYSQLEGSDEIYVGYDTQEQVYMKMFEELDRSISILKDNTTLGAEAWNRYDAVYYGNISQWVKYANSLKLRMAMRLSYVKPELAKTKAAEAIASGVIEANADNAAMHAAENRTTLIYNDWADHRVGADILCYMNGYEDPHREKMFTTVTITTAGETETLYCGIRIGIDVASKGSVISSYSNLIVTSDTPYMWMTAAEVSFLKSEYELRWGTSEEARRLYEQGIRLSFEEKGASGADTYITDNSKKREPYSSRYLSHPYPDQLTDITIAWENGDGNFERNLERIMTQKWIAIFPLGVEAWSEYRRTGYPKLMPHPAQYDKSNGTVDLAEGARRLPYPVEEYQLNRANLENAVTLLDSESSTGAFKGDKMGTRIWWDCRAN